MLPRVSNNGFLFTPTTGTASDKAVSEGVTAGLDSNKRRIDKTLFYAQHSSFFKNMISSGPTI